MADEFKNCEGLKDPLEYIPQRTHEAISLSDTNASEILKLIFELDINKSVCHDEINNRIIKNTGSTTVPYLETLYNKCMRSGVYPDCFKTAQVTPLFKGGDKLDLGSYRPISLLPALGKLFEKIILVRMMYFLDKHDLISNHQFGFRPKYTTEYAILDVYEKLLSNMDRGTTSCAIFLDLAKAFDSVSHNILLRKLEKYGFRGNALKLLTSYLSSRSQFVKLGDVKSITSLIEFGVPQGSILGPILFLLFINDLPNATKLFVKLYADDTFLCAQNDDIKLLVKEVNLELTNVFKWLCSNKLTLNFSKTKYMVLTKKRDVSHSFTVKMGGKKLQECNTYKYLGVMFDKDLNWKSHIEYICSKICKVVGGLAKLRYCADIEILREVYFALIHSYVRYGIIAWGNITKTNVKPLNVILNRAIRIMSFAPFSGKVELKPLYHQLQIMDIDQTFKFEVGKFMYKSKNNILPTEIAKHFENEVLPEQKLGLRRRENNTIPKILTMSSSGEKSIQTRGEQHWANIPPYLKDLDSFASFKRFLKSHLLE